MNGGDFVFVTHGTIHADTGWICSEPVTIVGSSPVIFVQFSGSGAYDAGHGLQRDGTLFSVKTPVGGAIVADANGINLAQSGVTPNTYGSATQSIVLTVNDKGLVTSASTSTITPAVGSITGLGTGVSSALSATLNADSGLVTVDGNATLTNKTLVAPNIGAATGTSLSLSGNLTVDGNTLFVDNVNNRVGVGTTSPATRVHILGALRVDNGSAAGSLIFGADINGVTRSSNVRKLAAIVSPDYANTRNIEWATSDSSSSLVNLVSIGGRVGGSNYAATSITLVTAPNVSTTGGTAALHIDSSQRVGIGTTSPNAAAVLDVTSTTQGFLPPRMTSTQRDAIASPPDGLEIYNTTTNRPNVRSGGVWREVASGTIGTTSDQVVTTTTNGVLTTSSRSGIDSRTSFPNSDVTAATSAATVSTIVKRDSDGAASFNEVTTNSLNIDGNVYFNDISNYASSAMFTYSGSSATTHRTALSINNVDNTSDANKPISTAVSTALAGKSNVGHGHVISDVTNLQTTLDSKAALVDPVRTTLTGTGSVSTYAISGASGLVNPSALIVAIDGILQEPSVDYTVSNGNITFTSPLPSGSKAVVIAPTNSLQISQNIPADGSVTSSKLDADLIVQDLTVINSLDVTTLNLSGNLSAAGTDNRLTAQTVVDASSIMTRDLVDSRYFPYSPSAHSFGSLVGSNTALGPFMMSSRVDGTYNFVWGTNNPPAPALPFFCNNSKSINTIRIQHTAGTHPTAQLEVGIYLANAAGLPDQYVTKVAFPLNTIGNKTQTLASTFTPNGLFWVMFRPTLGDTDFKAGGNGVSLGVRGYSIAYNPWAANFFGAQLNNDVLLYGGSLIPARSFNSSLLPTSSILSQVGLVQSASAPLPTCLLY
jgi:hypothetical protein